MTRSVVTVASRDSCQRALSVMGAARIDHLPVLDRGRVVGILTAGDIHRRAPKQAMELVIAPTDNQLLSVVDVAGVMTYQPVTVNPLQPFKDALQIMFDRRIGCLPVVDRGQLLGILTKRDAIRLLIEVLQRAPRRESRSAEEKWQSDTKRKKKPLSMAEFRRKR
jgi:acetoin utilization protein AcuB